MAGAGLHEPAAQRIGPYEVLVEIGSGGMGTISLACATGEPLGVDGFARLVAIKRPHFGGAPDHEVMSRFLDEARLLAQIHHANVVGIHQIGADAGGHFLVLDYVEGGALDELCGRAALRRRKLPPPVVLRILSDVLAGLHAVHEAVGVEGEALAMLHRDVSTQNVLIGRDGVARLADFGIAKAIISSTVTDKAYLHGRLQYMTPEYLRRDAVDRRIDVYAAGVTMWSALAGRIPWEGASEAQIVHELLHVGLPPLSSAGVRIAPDVQAIVTRACERDRERRYPTARAMLDDIEELGRRTGWLASHAEVAALVEELLGLELRERRAAIARRLASLAERPPAPPPSSAAGGPPGRAEAGADSAPWRAGWAALASLPVTAPPASGGHVAPGGAMPVSPSAPATGGVGVAAPVVGAATGGVGVAAPVAVAVTGGFGVAAPVAGAATGGFGVAAGLPATAQGVPTGPHPVPPSSTGAPPARRRGVVTAVALLVALGGALAAWKWSVPGAAAGDAHSLNSETGPAPSPPSPSVVAQPVISSSPVVPPQAVAPAPSATPAAASAEPAASASAVPAASKGAPAPVRPPPSRPGTTGPADLPTGISTSNPYRPR